MAEAFGFDPDIEPAQSQPREGEAALELPPLSKHERRVLAGQDSPEADALYEPAPEQPTREARVDLAERLERIAERLDVGLFVGITDSIPLREAASALRASAHPEQSARVEAADLAQLRRMLDPDSRPRRATTYADREAIRAVLAAFEPAPTEEGGDR